MTKNTNRKDDIRKAALDFEEESLRICVDRYSFVRGAEWADSNPKCPWTLVEDFYPSIIRDKTVSEKVLIQFKNGDVDIDVFDWTLQMWVKNGTRNKEIVAWMYIPDFPKC